MSKKKQSTITVSTIVATPTGPARSVRSLPAGTLRFVRARGSWYAKDTCPVVLHDGQRYAARPEGLDLPADEVLLGWIEPNGTVHMLVPASPKILKAAQLLGQDIGRYGVKPKQRARNILRAYVNEPSGEKRLFALSQLEGDVICEQVRALREEHEVFAAIAQYLDSESSEVAARKMWEVVAGHGANRLALPLCAIESRQPHMMAAIAEHAQLVASA